MPRTNFPHPSILLLASALALTTLTTTLTAIADTSSATMNGAVNRTEKQPILLADEIIRRLRRLGLNFTKNRIAHPYDPFGELC